MQERAVTGDAEKHKPTWYLSRGDKRYGPLADRELLLLAEQGGLRTDDLLWKPGFDSWKSVHAFCDVSNFAESASLLPAGTPSDEFADAAVDAAGLGEPANQKKSLRARAYEELRKFLIIFSYLWLVFFVFLVHEWVVLASNNIGFRFYGLALVNALVLSKIMLIAEAFKFAERLDDKPLVYPIAFKSISFSVLLMVSYIVEEIVVGLFHGKSVAESFPHVGNGGLVGVVTVGAILCIALVPFFGFREIARVIGKAEFRSLMLGPVNEERGSESLEQGMHPLPIGVPTS
ncbi:MAG TPA: DUF4339 domain-containing protein [Methyloceanibacter sp.]|nr:DUF4339 domain-containing protein [Methyloceanibacter sp.]